jgi:tetratricopeptide (TPR) repeat protein
MEQMATPGSILLAPATFRLTEGYVQVAARGPVAVKGLPEPLEVYVLAGANAQRTRVHAAAARGLTNFVGRDAELERLRRSLALAHDGRGQLVAVVGEPGVGKSRLVYELTHSHRTQDWLVLETGSVSYGKATSYLPVIGLLKAYFKVHRETHREIREKVTGKLLTLDRSLEPIVPAVLALLDVPLEDARWQALDPAERRRHTLNAVSRLLLREAEDRPVLVVFEDLHWIDAETQALLDSLVESLPSARLLLLVNYRPEYRHGWAGESHYSHVRLDALPPESAAELLQSLLGDDSGLEPVKRLLVRRGNPFFIEESIRTLVETRALAGARGAYRLTRPIEAIEVPATVQVILAARIDRLPAEDKQLLQTASVIGKDVPSVLLRAVSEQAEDAVQRGLAHLQAAAFIHETRLFPDVEYTFKHALTHEVTYGTLLQDRRRALHARIMGAIEHSYPDRVAEHVEHLGYHALRGELWEEAVRYLRQAGAKAMARSANREAVSSLEQALVALTHVPESRQRLEQAIDLRFDLRNALFPLGEFERIAGYLREAEDLAKALDDRRRLGQQSVYMCHHLFMVGEPTKAVAFGQAAQAIAEALGDVALQATGSLYLGVAYTATGDYRLAEKLLLKVLETLDGNATTGRWSLAGFPEVTARFHLTWAFTDLGEFEKGIAYSQGGLRLAESMGRPYWLAPMFWIPGYLHTVRGEFAQAVALLERGVALSREWSLTYFLVAHTGSLGYAYALSGRLAEGIALLEHAVGAGDRMGFEVLQPAFLGYLAEAYARADRLEDARESAGRALSLARDRGQRGYEAWVRRLLGDIAARHVPPEHADGHYCSALTLAGTLGMRPLVAHCHLGLGKLCQRTGNREQALVHLTTATTLYREMDMRYWLEKAEAEMRELL